MTSQRMNMTNRTNPITDGIRNDATIFDLSYLSGNNIALKVFVSPTPQQSSIEHFVEFMIEEGITNIFNFCNETLYDCDIIQQNGISVHEFSMTDGSVPNAEILDEFNPIIDEVIKTATDAEKLGTILFHCQAGLGRAPTMLAYLMMSRFGWKNKRIELITMIRSKRRNALNHAQLSWIRNSKITTIRNKSHPGCIIV